ncbi:oxygenase MpaB family protein [Actinocorallia populi]|uniref:oxygenase MpaB family protein n=1 Tax=Actinocorallia populi TaxID=2079200 RepID=UPI000D08FE8A|nr:oxygenase MpaB family protein [Actinocorallia populi]
MRESLPFRPGDVSWKVGHEPVLALAAAPTLLLQVCHPLVAAGVARYSDFASDPFARLWRTLDIQLKLSYGRPEVSARQSELLHRIHQRVQGVSEEGVPYRALDPELLLWVWATLVHGQLTVYELTFGVLSKADRETFYREQQLVAHACGVPEGACPPDFAAFRRYFARMLEEELEVTETARQVVSLGNDLPRLPPALGAAYSRFNLLAAGAMLPRRLREGLGIPWSPRRDRLFRMMLLAGRAGALVVPGAVRGRPVDALVDRERPLRLFAVRRARAA